MARRVLVDIDTQILNAVMEIGAAGGIASVTTQKVAKICGISHFTCFDHFGTKQNMLDKAAEVFENRYMEVLMSHMAKTTDIKELLLEMLEELRKDANGTLYFLNYVTYYSYMLTPQKNTNFTLFKGTIAKTIGDIPGFTDEMYMLTWDYIVTQVFLYAKYMIRHQIPDDEQTRLFVRDFVFKGIDRVIFEARQGSPPPSEIKWKK